MPLQAMKLVSRLSGLFGEKEREREGEREGERERGREGGREGEGERERVQCVIHNVKMKASTCALRWI